MDPSRLFEQLSQLPDRPAREAALRRWLPGQPAAAIDDLLERLRQEGVRLQMVDGEQALAWARLIRYAAGWEGRPQHLALGLRVEAQIRTLAQEDYGQALALFDAAIKLLNGNSYPVERARIEVTRVWALACVGRMDEALTVGNAAADVLRQHGVWTSLGVLFMNLAVALNRAGEQRQALTYINAAESAYANLGETGRARRIAVTLNRALILSDLGRYRETISIFEEVRAAAAELGLTVAVGLATFNLGRVFYLLGQYGRALKLHDEASSIFQGQQRGRDTLLIELSAVQCLLSLRRFHEAIAACGEIRGAFGDLGLRQEMAEVIRSEAQAYEGLQQYDAAQASYGEARRLFVEEASFHWAGYVDLEMARLLAAQQRYEASLELAQAAADQLHEIGMPALAALAELKMAEIAWRLGDQAGAGKLLGQVREYAGAEDVPELRLAADRLSGLISAAAGDMAAAAHYYELAIASLERLQRQVMIEHRADYLDDKQDLFELMVAAQLELEQPERAFTFVERAKSQALIDMVALRLDVGVRARTPADQPLVDALNKLQAERDQLVRQWREQAGALRPAPAGDLGARQKQLADLEQRITAAWHRLLIHNEQYASDAALWSTRYEPVSPYLDEDTVLVDYFTLDGELVAFLLAGSKTDVFRLGVSAAAVEKWLQRLHFYMRTTARARPAQLALLTKNTQQVLRQLYTALIAPFAQRLFGKHLIVVPHGALHYLPFHALFDGQAYLLETSSLSYLPGATFLRYCRQAPRAAGGALVVGNSFQGALAFTQAEAVDIAATWQTEALLEDAATLAAIREGVVDRRLLHLAAHGDFRADNPLFSGIALADGWLTTLAVFDLQLRASLVTLSACQTGMSVVGGGNELLGLMRAFMSAGAASLISSLWTVDDHSTALLMRELYNGLAAGRTKAESLRQAQLCLRHGRHDHGGRYDHPFFWAPFYLVGDDGPL